jgi:putative ABC transport system substrate-binding protein
MIKIIAMPILSITICCGPALAEPRNKEKKVAVVTNFSENDAVAQDLVKSFANALDRAASNDVAIKYEYYWSGGNTETAKIYAKKVAASSPDAIFAATTPVVSALLNETKTIPIVFATVADPIGSGFVENLAAPGKNVTGFINSEGSIAGKWAQYLKELLPDLPCISMMYNTRTAPYYKYYVGPFEDAAKSVSIEPILSNVSTEQEIEGTIRDLSDRKCGLVLMNDSFNFVHRQRISTVSEQYRVPVVAYNKATALNEALIAYGPEEVDAYRKAAGYVKKIIDGAQVGKLPVQLNTRFYLSVNLQKAKRLGIEIPASFLSRVDDEVE